MEPYEIRVELTEEIVQELLWHALTPDAIVITRHLNEALEQQHAQIGRPPAGANIAGISVVAAEGRMYAELSYV